MTLKKRTARLLALLVVVLLLSTGSVVTASSLQEYFTFLPLVDKNLFTPEPPGTLDEDFGQGGYVITDVNDNDSASDAALQPDGKLVVVGKTYIPVSGGISHTEFAVLRYNADGSLDPSFGGDGIVTTIFELDYDNKDAIAQAVALQPDGKILVVGNTMLDGLIQWAIVRYNPDGSLDKSFSADGRVTLSIPNTNWYVSATDVVLLPDNKFLVSGNLDTDTSSDFSLVRYNPDGTLDTSFGGGDGIVTTNIQGMDFTTGMEVQADGKIVLAGKNWNYPVLVRYLPDGSLDPDFGTNGIVVNESIPAYVSSLAIQPDGNMLIAGTANEDILVMRYTTDGLLDTTFNGQGYLKQDIDGFAYDVASTILLLPDASILVAGTTHGDVFLMCLTPDGSLDLRLAGDGIIITDIAGTKESIGSMLLQPDSKVVLVGGIETAPDSNLYNILLLRYHFYLP
jgi:uncharacterized delta-60 repeat protein